MQSNQHGSLVVVGTGISVAGQMTLITQNHVRQADIVYVAIPNKPGEAFIKQLNPNTHTLTDLYELGKSRVQTYQDMCDRIINSVEAGQKVCAAFYGHPGVFVNPSHRVIEVLKERGFSVMMEPGISAEDCLVADLGIDPAAFGCQSYEATQFLFRRYTLDPHMTQIIWQIWGVGDHTLTSTLAHEKRGLAALVSALSKYYPEDHPVIVYEARTSPLFTSRIDEVKLAELTSVQLSPISTLVIPSLGLPDFDHETLDSLGITAEDIQHHLSIKQPVN
ncbi:SAM-dependent methyltransferase [Alteromonas oceanisediminis]|uniref:SAM-dependent methyltransferase n=1 Tax=Alteromonas oceanisediminis TaxID=2836180 RepID=UPI001BDB1243|nr:SAM-dependent methyltransferase [Alteromonas oceanisediminis]MBT0586630.1 methylase [Alteromonas oceanisediminis]